jgi:hypothetical protein
MTKNVVLGLAVIFLFTAISAPTNKFKKWLSALLGIDTRFYTAASETRARRPVLSGEELIQLTLKSKEEKVIWRATGLASPISVGPIGIAVLRHAGPGLDKNDAGLWVVSNQGEPRLIISDDSLLVIFGPVKPENEAKQQESPELLVLKNGKDQRKTLIQVNVVTKHVAERRDVPEGPLDFIEQLPRSGAFRNNRFLDSMPPAWQLQIRDVESYQTKYDELIGPSGDNMKRIDPIWIDDGTICYVRHIEATE